MNFEEKPVGRLNDLSVLIVTWNGDALLRNCLYSCAQACGADLEIIVVDNGNLDSTRQIAASYDNVTYVASERNLGFAGGNNLGLPFCTRKYVLLLNNDTEFHTDPFTPLISYLEGNPSVAAVQGRMRLVRQGDVLDECGSLLGLNGELTFRGLGSPTSKLIATRAVFHGKGACLMFRRDLLPSLGGVLFYDHFKSYYEDVDFCHRLWLTGKEVHFVNTPFVDHLAGVTGSRLPRRECLAQHMGNQIFSLLTLFGTYGLCSRFLLLCLTYCSRFVGTMLLGRWQNAMVYVDAVRSVWGRRKSIVATRRFVQRMRRISDRELFKKISA